MAGTGTEGQSTFWWNGGNRTASGTILGNFWNEVSGTTARNEFNALEAEKARVFSSAEAEKNRDWETYMSNTAYQRAVEDMKKAGLNPASIGGNAASTPSAPQAPSAAAAQSAGGGSGGILGLIAKAASAAIAGSIASKFQNSAKMAGTAAGAVKNVSAEAASAAAAARQSQLQHEGDWLYQKRLKQERKLYQLYANDGVVG